MNRSRKNPLLVEIGTRLRESRVRAGLTQSELAYQARLNARYVGCVERGEKHIAVARLLLLLGILGANPVTFFRGFPKELLPPPAR